MSVELPAETQIAIAVVQQGQWVLIGQRPAGAPLAGLWEFPGGKVQPGERPEAAAVRECQEETGLSVTVLRPYGILTHHYTHGTLRLHFFQCQLAAPEQGRTSHSSETPQPMPPFQWVPQANLSQYEFPEANRPVLAELAKQGELRARSRNDE